MRYSLLLLAVIATLPAFAYQQPVIELAQSESKAQSKLYDAELTDVHTSRDGLCFKFDGFSIFDKDKSNLLRGKICGDQIKFDQNIVVAVHLTIAEPLLQTTFFLALQETSI